VKTSGPHKNHDVDACAPGAATKTSQRMTAIQRLSAMPAWPLLMDAATGALYLEVSPESFLAIVRRAGLRPVDLGVGVVRWRRPEIDQLIQGLPVRGGQGSPALEPIDFDAALQRAAKRPSRRAAS
jgi:hypothetical protein